MLAVTVNSFSYRSGIPTDPQHGGGFVFDLRCLSNPGRDPAFRDRTGLDVDVRAFLDGDAEVRRYYQCVVQLVEQAVKAYADRGFDSLMVSFGCTGGQHRSVFFAAALSQHLRTHFQVEVRTQHLELSRKNLLPLS